jgi:putative ATP-binding cassette transporter
MALLSFLLRASRRTVALAVVAGICAGVSGVALIALIHAGLSASGPSLRILAWAFGGLCLLTVVTRIVAQVAMVRLAQGSVSRLALHLCSKILELPLERFEDRAPGSLLAVLTEDVAIITGALVGIPLLCVNVPVVIGCLVYIGWLSPTVLLCGLAFAVPAVLGYQVLATRGFRALKQARVAQEELVSLFRSLIDGFRELKLHRARREAFLHESLQTAAKVVGERNSAGFTSYTVASGWSVLAFFGVIGSLVFVGRMALDVDARTLSGAILAILYLMAPLDLILTWIPILSRAQASLLRIQSLIPSLESAEPHHESAEASETSPEYLLSANGCGSSGEAEKELKFQASLRLSGVTYAYGRTADSSGFELGPIDLVVPRGELTILAGGNGSGKTTLVKLLAGLYAPASGEIAVDGQVITSRNREAHRQLFSVVFADGHLFPSLLGVGSDTIGERAQEFLRILKLDRVVSITEGAFSTTDLSQGQRKRLALLTACLEDRPILVCDEWAAYQDPHFKRVFYREILPELKARGKTLLIISHDDAYYSTADRVLRLTDGLLAEDVTALAVDQSS